MKNRKSLTGLIVVLVVVYAGVLLVRHFHIKNFHVIKPGVLYCSGQPRGMDYTRLLYKHHIGTIVNLRSASEHREDNWYSEEITWVRENGVNYIELPIEKNALIDEAKGKKFVEIMSNRENWPVLVHCSSGETRAPMIVAIWLVKSEGYTAAQSVAIAEKIRGRALSKEEKLFISRLSRR